MNNHKHKHKHGHRIDKDKHLDKAIRCQYNKERVLRSTATIQRSLLMKRRLNRLSQWRIRRRLRRLRRLRSSRPWYSVIITSTWYSARSVAAECEKKERQMVAWLTRSDRRLFISYLLHITSFWLASRNRWWYPGVGWDKERSRLSASTRVQQLWLQRFSSLPSDNVVRKPCHLCVFCTLSSVFRSYNGLDIDECRTLFIC